MEFVVILAFIVPLVIGLVLGLIRGSRRATLRIALVLLCLVVAFCVKDAVTQSVMEMEVEGQPLEEYILSQLPEELASMSDVIYPIVVILVSAILFLVMFFAIKFLSWAIIYPICKIFVKKGRKKHALIGGVIGLVQGAAVGLVLCVMLNGLFLNFANVAEAMDGLQGESEPAMVAASETEGEDYNDGEGSDSKNPFGNFDISTIIEYKDSKVCGMINGVGGNKMFDFVASMKTDEGKKLTLSGQIDALSGMVKMAKELGALTDMDMVGGLSDDVATNIATIFNKLDEISNNLSDESKETMNNIVQIVADNFFPEDMGIDVSILDFTTIDFANEANVITKLNEYKDLNINEVDDETARAIVQTVYDSDILLPLLSSNDDFTIGLEPTQQAYAKKIIDDMASKSDANQEKIDMLKNFFGLNDSNLELPPID